MDANDLFPPLTQTYPHEIWLYFNRQAVWWSINGDRGFTQVYERGKLPELIEIFFDRELVYALDTTTSRVSVNKLAPMLVNSIA